MSWSNRKNFLQILNVEELKIEPVEDDYCTRIHLKDNSIFRYTPRRMLMS